jgi:hypothetical protein
VRQGCGKGGWTCPREGRTCAADLGMGAIATAEGAREGGIEKLDPYHRDLSHIHGLNLSNLLVISPWSSQG